jgi:adenine-specific DNA-methyltransferase
MSPAREQRARLAQLLDESPALIPDLLRWAESARATGANRVFAAYRDTEGHKPDPARPLSLIARRRCGAWPTGNRLYHADNLTVLPMLLNEGMTARCIYIDPPYGTQQRFVRKVTDHAAYCDAASGAAYLAMLRLRLVLLRDMLDDEGSIFVHLDASMVAEVKLLLDELFGAANFRAWITRRKCSSKNYTRKTFGDISDYILFYSKTARYVFNRQFGKRSPEQEAIDFPKIDQQTGRRFALVPIHAPGRRNGATGGVWRGMLPPAGKHWQTTPDKLDEFEAKGDIHWTRNGTPRRKIWADESPGSAVANLWHEFRDPFNQNFATTGYPTEKNIDLLKLIISAASHPGDLVLDAYAGSGTTLAAAGALGRPWVGIDSGTLATALAQRRISEEILTTDLPNDQSFGFELRAADSPVDASSRTEIEFAFVERCRDSSVIPEVREVLKPGLVPGRVQKLRAGEQLIAFDHGGHEMAYERSDSIQATEKRPA